MATTKNTGENKTRKRGAANPQNLGPKWKPGQSGNPKGRPLGRRDRRTVIMEAIKRLAAKRNCTPEEYEELIQMAGLERAEKGSFFHYQEISNGLYGKITDKQEVNIKGKTLADFVAAAHGKRPPSSPEDME